MNAANIVIVGLCAWAAGLVSAAGWFVFAALREQALARVGRPLGFKDRRATHNDPLLVVAAAGLWPLIPVIALAWSLLVGARRLLERHYAKKLGVKGSAS